MPKLKEQVREMLTTRREVEVGDLDSFSGFVRWEAFGEEKDVVWYQGDVNWDKSPL